LNTELSGNLYEETTLGQHNIKKDLKDTGCEYVDCIHPAQDRVLWWVLVNIVMNIELP
jgi:hypothetical protein